MQRSIIWDSLYQEERQAYFDERDGNEPGGANTVLKESHEEFLQEDVEMGDEYIQEEEKALSEEEMEEQSTSVQTSTIRRNLRSSKQSVAEEEAEASSDDLEGQSAAANEIKKAVDGLIEERNANSKTASTLCNILKRKYKFSDLHSKIVKTIHNEKYTIEDKKSFIQLYENKKEQEYILRFTFDELPRRAIWKLFSKEEQKNLLSGNSVLRSSRSLSKITEGKAETSSDDSESPSAAAKELKKAVNEMIRKRNDISIKSVTLTGVLKNKSRYPNLHKEIKDKINNDKYTPKDKAAFVRLYQGSEQGLILKFAFNEPQRKDMLPFLRKEELKVYLDKTRIKETRRAKTLLKWSQKAKETLASSAEDTQGEEKFLQEDVKMGEQSTSAETSTRRWTLRSSTKQVASAGEHLEGEESVSEEEAVRSASDSAPDDSVPGVLLTPEEQVKRIEKQIKAKSITLTTFRNYPAKKLELRNILHKQGYTPEGIARFVNKLPENKQGYVLVSGFEDPERKLVWDDLQPEARNAYLHRQKVQAPAFKSRSYGKREATSSSDSEPSDSVPGVSLTPEEQAKKIKKQIKAKGITLTTVHKYPAKKLDLQDILHKQGYTPEGIARFVNKLPENKQGYVLVSGFKNPKREDVWDDLQPEAQNAYLHRQKVKDPRFKRRAAKQKVKDPRFKRRAAKQRRVTSKVLLRLLREDIADLMGISPINMGLVDNDYINQGLKRVFGKEIFRDKQVKAVYLDYLDDDGRVYILKHILSDEQRTDLWPALSYEVKEAFERDSQTPLAQNLASQTTPDLAAESSTVVAHGSVGGGSQGEAIATSEAQSAVEPDLSATTKELERILQEMKEEFMNEPRFPSGVTFRELYAWIDNQEVLEIEEVLEQTGKKRRASFTEPTTSKKLRQSVQEPIGPDMGISSFGKRSLAEGMSEEEPISKRTRSKGPTLSTEASSSFAPTSSESIPFIEEPISKRTRSKGPTLSTEASSSFAPASSESIPPIEELLNEYRAPRSLSDVDLALIMLKTAQKKDWDEFEEEDWDDGTEEKLPPLFPIVTEQGDMTESTSAPVLGGGMSSMIETINPPPHRREPLTQPQLNAIRQQQLNTPMAAWYYNNVAAPLVTGNRPAQTTLAGGGTFFDDVANFVVSDTFDPRLGSNEVHEWVHAWQHNNQPIRNRRNLGANRWIMIKIFQEKEAQMRAMEYMGQCIRLNLHLGVSDLDFVWPALMKEFRMTYRRMFRRAMIQANFATPNNYRTVAAAIYNNPATQRHQMILQRIGPFAQWAGEQRVLQGIMEGDVITAHTGHTYDYYFGMIWDNRFHGWAGRRAVVNYRVFVGLNRLRRKKFRIGMRATSAGISALLAGQAHTQYTQARTALNQQVAASTPQIVTANQQIAAANQRIDALNQQIAAANQPAIGAARLLGTAIRRQVPIHRRAIARHQQTIATNQQTIATNQLAITLAKGNLQAALRTWTHLSYVAREKYKEVIAAEAISGLRTGTTLAPHTQNVQLTQGSQHLMGTRWRSLIQAQTAFQTSLTRVNKYFAGNLTQDGFAQAKSAARADLALLWEQEVLAGEQFTDMPAYIEPQLRGGASIPGVITLQTEQQLERRRFLAVRRFYLARYRLARMKRVVTLGGLTGPFREAFLGPYRAKVGRLRIHIRRVYARLRWAQRVNRTQPITKWSGIMQPRMRQNKVRPPYAIKPSSVETLPPPIPLTTDKDYPQVTDSQWHTEPFEQVDMTGQLLQKLENPFVQQLASTKMGRSALLVEREFGGNLLFTNGAASSYDERTNAITVGLGPNFALGERFAQKKYIHEQTHRFRTLAGLTPDPLKYEQKKYVEGMVKEEAASEGNGADHVMELYPDGPFTQSESIYVEAYRAAYRKGYDDLQKMMLWATEEQLHAYARVQGIKSGQEALIEAMKKKVIVPSTVPQDLTRSKEELYGYEEYYADHWQKAREEQQQRAREMSEVDGGYSPP